MKTPYLVLSIFGEVEAHAANALIRDYPAECCRVPRALWPNDPELWASSQTREPVRFAILMPIAYQGEFLRRAARLRN